MAFGWRGSEESTPLDRLAKLVAKGKPIPGTDQVRAVRAKALELVSELAVASPEGIAARDALETLFREAAPVPLTRDCRFERPEAERLIEEIRTWK
jgi:hypothetical protein